MRVIVPVTTLALETAAALEVAGVAYETVDVSGSLEAYCDLLSELWAAGEDFVIVEHDIVIEPETLPSFEDCPRTWCCGPYDYAWGEYAGLGCVRFRSELLTELPDVMAEVAICEWPDHGPKHWCTLDAALHKTLGRHRRNPCQRHPKVGHLDPKPTHGCCE